MGDGTGGFVADENIGGLKVAFFASPIARPEQVEGPTARVRMELRRLAGELWAGRPVAASVPVAVVLTGGTEDLVLTWLDRQEMRDQPSVLLLALPYANSLPASLEILARLRQDGLGGQVLVLEHPGWRERLTLRLRAVQTAGSLRSARLGLVGGPSSWLAASSPSPGLVRERWGPEVVTIPLTELLDAYHDAVHGRGDHVERDCAALGAEVTRLRAQAAGVVEPDDETLLGAVAFHRALRELVDR
ncbi:MAG: hypothetical protein K6U08_09340 [Firmicutes bacterium]|nr:hypothetical protein [Bacillota bacterium]